MLYSPSQVIEMLSIPSSTLRHYAKKFSKHLSPQKGKHRLYTERDLLVLKKVKELSGSNLPLDVIDAQLAVIEVPAKEEPKPQETALSLIPSVMQEIETAQVIARAAQNKTDQLAADLEQLSAKVTQQSDQLASFKAWASLPWWKRLFSRPPDL